MFTGTVKLLANNLSTDLTVKRKDSFSFERYLPRDGVFNHCGKTITQDFLFSLSPYLEANLIESITVKSKYDDEGYSTINGVNSGSCSWSITNKCNSTFQYVTIDASKLKSTNLVHMFVKDVNLSDCSFFTNVTGSIVTIFINYR